MEIFYLLAIFVIGSAVVGAIWGQKTLSSSEKNHLNTIYIIWIVGKQAVLSFIAFAIVLFIVRIFLKNDIWNYLLFVIYCVINIFYTKNKVIDEYEIMLKPGEGILTPEGRRKIEHEASSKDH